MAGEAARLTETALGLARKAAQHLTERGLENARLESELMLASVLGIKRLDLYLQFDRPITEDELERFRGMVRRRLKREPLQYIVGSAGFRKLELEVNRHVLIPRPETEVLVDQVLAWLGEHPGSGDVVDIGTGSGAIALSIASESGARVVATDLSAEALTVARRNAQRAQVSDRVEFRAGSLVDALGPHETFAVIAANLPYVGEAERTALAPEVREWEPTGALFAGPDGLSLIRELVTNAWKHLGTPGLLVLEVGATQAADVVALIERSAHYQNARVVRDLAGRERIVRAEARVSREGS
jgi:release factor glutamine methyltransferase